MLVFQAWQGEAQDVVPAGFDVRNSVHEYGGGAYWLDGGTVFFTNFDDQRVYRVDQIGAEPRPVTPEPPQPRTLRYADGIVVDGTIVCVRERHEDEVVNELVLAARRRLGRADDHRLGPRLLLLADDEPRREAARVPELGPSTASVHRHRAVGRGAWRRAAPRCRRTVRVDLPAGLEPGRDVAFRLRPLWLVEPLPRAGRGGRGGGPDRSRARLDAMGVRDVQLRVSPGREDRLHPQSRVAPAPYLHRRRRVRGSRRALRLRGGPDPARAREQARLGRGLADGAAAPRPPGRGIRRAASPEPKRGAVVRRRVRLDRRADRVPDRRRHRLCLLSTRRRIPNSRDPPPRSRRSSSTSTAGRPPRASPGPTRPSCT